MNLLKMIDGLQKLFSGNTIPVEDFKELMRFLRMFDMIGSFNEESEVIAETELEIFRKSITDSFLERYKCRIGGM